MRTEHLSELPLPGPAMRAPRLVVVEQPVRRDRRELALVWTGLLMALLAGSCVAIVAARQGHALSGLHGFAGVAVAGVSGLIALILVSAVALVLAARVARRVLPPQT